MATESAAPAASVDQDAADLAQYGYKQELKRSLNIFSSFAVAFSYISPATGIFTLFILGIGTLGGAFFWTWPVVWLGQFIVALVFAEVSTHFPLAGSVFQWTKYLSKNKTYAWYAGWIYLWAGALTVAAVVATLPLALIPMIDNLGISSIKMDPASLTNQKWIAAVTLIVITMLNIFGVRLVALINNTGVLFEILGLFVFAIILALFNHHQSVGVVFHTGGPSFNASNFLVAMFMGLFVIYGFDTASTLAEESHEPRKKAPQAVLASIAAAGVIGGVFIYAMLLATPGSMSSVIKAGGISPAAIIDANLSNALSVAYLLVVSVAIFVCCLSIQASTIRLGYGMSRDRQLPFSGAISRVNQRTGTPIGACIMVALMAAIFLLKYAGVAYIAIAATGMILPLLPVRHGGDHAGAVEGLAAREGRLQPRPLGHAHQRAGDPLGPGHAGELRLAPRGHQPEGVGDHRARLLELGLPQQRPDPVADPGRGAARRLGLLLDQARADTQPSGHGDRRGRIRIGGP